MSGRRSLPSLVEIARDESGNRRMWASERDAALKRLREWRRTVRRMAQVSVERVREKMPWRLVGLTLMTVAVSAFYVHWSLPPKPDPNYVEARKIVRQYELGKLPEALDYRHATYAKALELLAAVDRHSISVFDARDFTVEMRRSIKVFEERRRVDQERIARARRENEARERSLELSQRFTSGVDKAAVFANECEEELEQFEARMDVLGGRKE
jgi:hypothetical protein